MPTNRISRSSEHFTSKISARQWAQMARDKNLAKHAEAWEQAYRDGWDDLHYRPDPQPGAEVSVRMLAAGDR